MTNWFPTTAWLETVLDAAGLSGDFCRFLWKGGIIIMRRRRERKMKKKRRRIYGGVIMRVIARDQPVDVMNG